MAAGAEFAKIARMGLDCLIVTCDPTLLGYVHTSLVTHGASLHHRQDSTSAIDFAFRRHLDGLVIEWCGQNRNSNKNNVAAADCAGLRCLVA